jgi:hypothetical protein
MWVKLDIDDSEDDNRYINDEYSLKVKFLFDEHFSPLIVNKVKSYGYSCFHVNDFNLKGHPDENIYGFSIKRGFVLVTTNTKDFWPESPKIPLKNSRGVICLETSPGDEKKIISFMEMICNVFGRIGKLLIGSKVKISGNEIIIKYQGKTKIEMMKYDVRNDVIYELQQ